MNDSMLKPAAIMGRIELEFDKDSPSAKDVANDFQKEGGLGLLQGLLERAKLWRLRIEKRSQVSAGTPEARVQSWDRNGLRMMLHPAAKFCVSALLSPVGGWGDLTPDIVAGRLSGASVASVALIPAGPPVKEMPILEAPMAETNGHANSDNFLDLLLGARKKLEKTMATIGRLKEIADAKRDLQRKIDALDAESGQLMAGNQDLYLQLAVLMEKQSVN